MPELQSPKRSLLLLSLAVLVADQWSKWWVEANLALHRPVEIIPGLLNLTHVENPGVAFGLFSDHSGALGPSLLIVLGLVALGVVAYYYSKVDPEHTLVLVALALVLGGAVGNLTDRVMSASVTDFIDVYFRSYHWHTFNIADSAITIGVLLILFDSFRPHPSGERTRDDTPSDPPTGEPAPESAGPGAAGSV